MFEVGRAKPIVPILLKPTVEKKPYIILTHLNVTHGYEELINNKYYNIL